MADLRRRLRPAFPDAVEPREDRWTRRIRPPRRTAWTRRELRQFIERYERLEAEEKKRRTSPTSRKEVMAEANPAVYDTKVIRKVHRAALSVSPTTSPRKRPWLEMYKEALGMRFERARPASGAEQGDAGDAGDPRPYHPRRSASSARSGPVSTGRSSSSSISA